MRTQRAAFAALMVLLCLPMVSAGPGVASVHGKVILNGQPVNPKTINMVSEPSCAKLYSHPPTTEEIVTGLGGALQNVVVYVSAGAPPENAVPNQPVTLDQRACRYAPHVLALQTKQVLQVVNNDHVLHNIHPLPSANREWNKAEPPGGAPLTESFAREEIIPIKCNIHPWMRGYIAVLKTSEFAVTREDGAFALNNLPPGKYTITAWHESLGTQSQEVVIGGTETKEISFVFKSK
jgi:plastocyanin